jgi:ADP-heptose:LPS heptosyltransferase
VTSSRASQTCVAFRLGALGDVVLTTGVLEWWRRHRGLSFIFITRSGSAPILRGHPAIERVVAVPEDRLHGMAWAQTAFQLSRQYAGLPLLDLHGTLRSRILGAFWRGPVERYPKFGTCRRLFRALRWDILRRHLEHTNVPQRYSLALENIPPKAGELLPLLRPGNKAQARATTLLHGCARPLVALHPYATHPDKAWPREHWHTLARLLTEAGLDWYVLGRNSKPLFADRGPDAESGRPGRDLTNTSSLEDACALLSRSDVLVTNDSGPMHLAAGVRTPVVALFGPTSRAWGFYPAGPSDVVLERAMDCRPCSLHGKNRCTGDHACLRNITPEETLQAVLRVLKRPN